MLRISSSLVAVAFVLSACSSDEAYDFATDADISDVGQQAGLDTGQAESGIGADSLPANQPAPGTQEELELSVGDRVFFDYDSAVLSPVATETLDRQGAWLRQYPNLACLLYTSPSPRDQRGSRMPSSA